MTKQVGESGKYLQDFDKGATDSERGEKLKGREYIWCRGNYIPED